METKFFIVFCCLFFWGAVDIFSVNYEEIFLEANLLYKKGEFAAALERYEQIDFKGRGVWHNMAFCADRLGRPLEALTYARRALLQSFHADARLLQLIDSVHNQLGLQQIDQGLYERMTSWVGAFRLLTWQILFLFAWFLALASYYFSWPAKVKYLFLFLLIFLAFAVCVRVSVMNNHAAIVKKSTVVRVGRKADFDGLSELKMGDTVVVRDSDAQWTKIVFNGISGWVASEDLVFL